MPATRKPKVSQAALTILPAPALALLARALRELSAMCKEARSEHTVDPQRKAAETLGYGIKSESNDLNGSWHVIMMDIKQKYLNFRNDLIYKRASSDFGPAQTLSDLHVFGIWHGSEGIANIRVVVLL